MTSEREQSPASQLNPDGTRTRYSKRQNADGGAGSLSTPPLSIRKRVEECENAQSIAEFLNESRLSPGEAEALRVNAEFEKSIRASASKENVRPGYESHIGSIRPKVSSVIGNFTITPPRSAITSAESSFNLGTPTKRTTKKGASIDLEDLIQKQQTKDRTLSTASTTKVDTPPESLNHRDSFFSIPYEATSPLHPSPTTDRGSGSIRRKPLLSINTSTCAIGDFLAISEAGTPSGNPGNAIQDNASDDPFYTRHSKTPAGTHPLIVASNSWVSEMHAITEEPNTHLEVSAAPLAPSSERSSEDSEVLAVKTLFAQKAQELKAQNGEKEVFDDDHPAVKNFKRAYKARAHGVDSPSKSGRHM